MWLKGTRCQIKRQWAVMVYLLGRWVDVARTVPIHFPHRIPSEFISANTAVAGPQFELELLSDLGPVPLTNRHAMTMFSHSDLDTDGRTIA